MRKMLTPEFIAHNIACFKKQMSRFIDFTDDKAIMVNNADWLLDLNYIKLLREVGVHFSVNRMLTAECFKKRLERGLSFFEFNYMIMQAYDFWTLNKKYGCVMEMGGDDQWSNMLAEWKWAATTSGPTCWQAWNLSAARSRNLLFA